MGFIRKILSKIKGDTDTLSVTPPFFENESDYYRWFFTKNPEWSQPTPNHDEKIRWNGIQHFLESVAKEKNDFSILDLGCGRGWLTNLLSNYGYVKGVEPVESVAEYGQKIFPALQIESGNSKTLLENGHQKSFDLIVSSEVIEHVEEKSKGSFVDNMYHLLKDGGHVIITTPRKEILEQYTIFMKPSQPIEDWMTEKEVEDLFNDKGFITIQHQNLEKNFGGNDSTLAIYQLWLFKKL